MIGVIRNTSVRFSEVIEDFFKSRIEVLQDNYDFGPEKRINVTGGQAELTPIQECYDKLINTSYFKTLWHKFILEVLKPYFEDQPIYCQKLPSIRIFPADYEIQYIDEPKDGMNLHMDNEPPFYHPTFETNFWMPLIDCDHCNDLYFCDDIGSDKRLWTKRVNIKKNDIFVFSGDIIHGNILHNKSFNTRASLDFKALKISDYDTSLISDTLLVKKRGQYYKQTDWYSEQYYYDAF